MVLFVMVPQNSMSTDPGFVVTQGVT
jgi:hypothetical protein